MSKVFNPDPRDLNGSSYAGVIRCEFDVLVKILGAPNLEPSFDQKITCEWLLGLLTDENKSLFFSIYNWKDSTPPQQNSTWHVGSFHRNNPALFAFLEKTLGCEVIAK